ncbi:Metallo-hydrolase/oxidoreductase [Staphylotrichum tortipilum]|uniref:Metallo-hydrolase/oxidoreductase n=1 Tax=Staphylotrichum tortipilum TaxID=2831512 RepID=A0AAN6MT61_9PEZI|nr:Metallo-hydrolase/oxidoreductase [Staphylotrichum longicolle]
MGITTRIVFDLGVRQDTSRYSEPIRCHLDTRQPLSSEPDVVKSLAVHWDHVGEPGDFPSSVFIVGHGSLDILRGIGSSWGSHSFFEADLLDPMRTVQLSDPKTNTAADRAPGGLSQPWKPFDSLPATLDLFGDDSIYIVDAPGHLPGHINLLVRVSHDQWVYLAGDACHDRRIMRDLEEAEKAIQRIRNLEAKGIKVIFAHDVEWEGDSRNQGRSWSPQLCPCVLILHICWGLGVACPCGSTRACSKPGCTRFSTPIVRDTSSMMASMEEKSDLRQQFDSQLGREALHSGWASLLSLNPQFFCASLSLATVPRRKAHLSLKEQALVALAVDSAATHLYAPGIRTHVSAALKEGTSVYEVLEVLELSSTLRIHACNIGGKPHDEDATGPFDERQEELKREFAEKRGYWHGFWEDFLRLDPEPDVPWTRVIDGKQGALEPKSWFIAPLMPHLYVPGLKLYMKNALGYGATPQQILEVLEIATLLGLYMAHVASSIIEELTSAHLVLVASEGQH